ncbi:MAG: hypothetical protein ACLP1Q_07320 [Solirubrobacteraceae bacterium]
MRRRAYLAGRELATVLVAASVVVGMSTASAYASDQKLDAGVFSEAPGPVGGAQPTTLSTLLSFGVSDPSGEDLTVPEGVPAQDTATLGGSDAASATGTVTYRVYSDSECKDLIAEAGTVSVSGPSVPSSNPETLAPGTYYWQATYSGDELNDPSTSVCGSEIETVEPPQPTTLTTLLSDGSKSGEHITVAERVAVHDSATLAGANASTATGTVTYRIYSDSECKHLLAKAGSVTVNGTSVPPSSPVTLAPGTYYWQATYQGDELHDESTSVCGSEIETVEPPQPTTLTTSLSGGGKSGERVAVAEGVPVQDSATLAGANASSATGTVTYMVYSNSECSNLVAEAGTVSVSGAAVPPSTAETLAPGTYYWQATYNGDELHEPSFSECGSEVETVTPAVGSGGPSVDAECFTQFGHKSVISTTRPGDLILAFVAANGPASGGQTAKVSGGGLKWSLVTRENGELGDAELWEAHAPGLLHKAAFSVKLGKRKFDAALDVVAFKNAPGVGAVAGFSGAAGEPHGELKTTAADSWVWAVGDDWATSTPRVPGPAQQVVHQGFDSLGDTYWVQATDGVTPVAGTTVEINDTAPTADPFDLVLVEVL